MVRCLRLQLSNKNTDSPANQDLHPAYQICLCGRGVYQRNSNHPCRCQDNHNHSHDENTQASKDQDSPRACDHLQVSFKTAHLLTSPHWQCHRIMDDIKWVVSSKGIQGTCMT